MLAIDVVEKIGVVLNTGSDKWPLGVEAKGVVLEAGSCHQWPRDTDSQRKLQMVLPWLQNVVSCCMYPLHLKRSQGKSE